MDVGPHHPGKTRKHSHPKGATAFTLLQFKHGGLVKKTDHGAGQLITLRTDSRASGGRDMAGRIRKSRVREVPLSEVKGDLSHLLREAEDEDIVITRHGKPAGVLIGF